MNILEHVKVIHYSQEEEHALIRRAQGGDIDARNRLIENYVPLAVKLAGRYPQSKGHSTDDLIQEGTISLTYAIRGYEFDQGTSFMTYAYYWLRQRMGYYSRRYKNAISYPDFLTGKKLKPHLITAKARLDQGVSALGEKVAGNIEGDFSGHEDVERREAAEALKAKARKMLDERSLSILNLRCQGKTLKAIGKSHGLTRERVRQIERKAVDKLRAVAG